ncbi:MAG: PaaI family thioesterase [Chloroflexi bacterium]|nr:MAG: PaaI family thioesterase [Chloroflexota bacterium]
MSGIEYLEAVLRGEKPPPPMGRLMGMELIAVEQGRVLFGLTPRARHDNPMGITHGGVAATLLDSAMGCAVQSTLPDGASFTTVDLTVHYVATVTRQTGPIRAEGRVLHRGGRIATAEGRMTRVADGRLLAHASTTCLLMLPAQAPADAEAA